MPHVHVCPLSQVEATVTVSRASHLISIINNDTAVDRPASIDAANHLFIGVNDIVEYTAGLITPGAEHVSELLDFVHGWDRESPMVVHCFAGISRSTAAAFIAICAVRPEKDEFTIARRLREISPIAFPNSLIVAHGDDLLGRDGRMVKAVKAIGRGELAFENVPFALSLSD